MTFDKDGGNLRAWWSKASMSPARNDGSCTLDLKETADALTRRINSSKVLEGSHGRL